MHGPIAGVFLAFIVPPVGFVSIRREKAGKIVDLNNRVIIYSPERFIDYFRKSAYIGEYPTEAINLDSIIGIAGHETTEYKETGNGIKLTQTYSATVTYASGKASFKFDNIADFEAFETIISAACNLH